MLGRARACKRLEDALICQCAPKERIDYNKITVILFGACVTCATFSGCEFRWDRAARSGGEERSFFLAGGSARDTGAEDAGV
jgi:hypothetical protein